MARFEVITGPERRRRWSADQKRAIVAESFAPGSVVSEVARRADVSPGQIYRWRQELRAATGFAQVLIAPAESPEPKGAPPWAAPALEVELGQVRVRIPGSVPAAAMIPVPSGVRVWLAVGHTDMRRGMDSLALQVQQALGRDPHTGDLYVFRGKRGHLIKILWHDGIGMSLYAKRLERGRFIWPSPADGTVAITPAQLAYMLEGIDWRNPVHTWRPQAAG
jgi:transposase